MALLGFRQQIGDGQVEHAATAHGKQETQHELRQVSQEEPTGQGRAEKRDRDETGPFEGTPNRLSPRRVRPVADEQTNAERLAEVVDQDGQRNEQAKAALDGVARPMTKPSISSSTLVPPARTVTSSPRGWRRGEYCLTQSRCSALSPTRTPR